MKFDHFYGPGDSSFKFPIMIINQCLKNEKKIKLTKGIQLRDFIYIDDLIRAYMWYVLSAIGGDPDAAISQEEVVKKIPLNKIVMETDSYPQYFKKNRMRWTEPKDLNLIIIKLSEIFNIDKDIIVENIYNNSKKILRI